MDIVGLVGSPSTTDRITVDILEDTVERALRGELVSLTHQLEKTCLIAIGTVADIRTSNRWHEDPNMRGVLKMHGKLPHLSEVGDVRTADVLVQAAYESATKDPAVGDDPVESGGSLAMSPTTGAFVHRVTDEFLRALLRRHHDRISYLGRVYRMDNVRLPLILRHFGPTADSGAGEAFHTGVFGMTGSGKSVFTAYLLAAQLQHTEQAILIMDPQGQFTSEEGLPFSLQGWAAEHNRPVLKYSIAANLRLSKDAPLVGDLLALTDFFARLLTIKTRGDQRDSAVAEFVRVLQGVERWESRDSDSVLRNVLSKLLEDQDALTRIYSSAPARDRLANAITNMLEDNDLFSQGQNLFAPIHSLFRPTDPSGEPRQHIHQAIDKALTRDAGPRPILILDFARRPSTNDGTFDSESLLDSTGVKALILRRVCDTLVRRAESLYAEGQGLNALVVFDEAQRFAAESTDDSEAKALAERLVDHVRTTRKYGLGWMFITQEIGSLRRGIYSQLRIRCFGYGLTSGTELNRLRETIGDDSSLDLYRSFVDPQALDPRQYPFMLTGPISPLSFTGTPVFLSVYTDFEEFRAANTPS